MKLRNSSALGILLAVSLTVVAGSRAHAQIGEDDSSVNYLAIQIGASAGIAAENYQQYARKLAKTMSHLNSGQQARVFGFVPKPVGSLALGNTASTGASASGAASSGTLPSSQAFINAKSAVSGSGAPSKGWWEELLAAIKAYFAAK